ncbi:acetyl-CoA acetyltransferase [bacterium SM23_31]|nr:MAG: acetyl-CoA acetyltransferase [bacterium SM23_31]
MDSLPDVVIVSACRTPVGTFNGGLSTLPAPKLGAIAISEAVKRANIKPEEVNQVIMGCVLSGGMGQAPARQAAIFAGLPNNVDCMTVNKVCSSGLKAVMLGAQAIQLGDAEVIAAGGMENMSLAPYILESARTGYRLGHGQITDLMIKDGLWDVYNDFHMGCAAELCAHEMNITREEQDAYAAESYRRAVEAMHSGKFDDEIVAVEVPQRKGEPVVINKDEEPSRGVPEKFPKLRPAFEKEGTVTAANASSINDGAAAVVLMSAEKAASMNIFPLAKIKASAAASKAPEWFTTAPADAINSVLKKAGLTVNDIDLFEINEAFSCVSIANNKLLNLDPDKVNVNGGAVAIGHPIGASGARILATLLYAMKNRNVKRGLAALCNGGGEATAIIIERE